MRFSYKRGEYALSRLTFTLYVAAVFLAGCAGQSVGTHGSWYTARNAVAPSNDRMYVCHAFGCARRTPVQLTRRDILRLRNILANGRSSPNAERRAIARAVAWSERRVAPAVGSGNDVGGLDMQNAGVPGQMDCIDEATNTTSVLLVAERHGFLAHHYVTTPVARGFFLDGKYPHATAAIIEKKTGRGYAVDSWPRRNGADPNVMTLDTWFADTPSPG